MWADLRHEVSGSNRREPLGTTSKGPLTARIRGCGLGNPRARRPGARHPLHWRERAIFSGGFILSPSATLRVADLACPGRWREDEHPPQPNTGSGRSCTSRSILEPEAPPEAIPSAMIGVLSGAPSGQR
jgi:hypothetical protein